MTEWVKTSDRKPDICGWYFVCENENSQPWVMTLMAVREKTTHFMWEVPNTIIRYELDRFKYWQPIPLPNPVSVSSGDRC